MTQVNTAICEWAQSLPYWERAALNKVMGCQPIDEKDYRELLTYLLEDAGLAEKGDRPELCYLDPASQTTQPSAAPLELVRMFDLRNVNALVPEQTLWFGHQVTAIFGGNGSGKSGYARVLGSAGFTRGDTKVLPDITSKFNPSEKISVQLELSDGTPTIVHHTIGSICAELSSFYVFDSTSVVSHLTRSHILSFSPAGLSNLSKLADVTDKVRERMQDRVTVYSQPHSFTPHFQGSSPIADAIRSLGASTDTDEIKTWAALAAADPGRIDALDLAIAELKTLDPARQVALLTKQMAALAELRDKLRDLVATLESDIGARVASASMLYTAALDAAERAGSSQFNSITFTSAGSDQWLKFIQAARRVADLQGTSETPYPTLDSSCLLCQQPLSPSAAELLRRLWRFLQTETQEQVQRAKEECDRLEHALRAINFEILPEHSLGRSVLQEYNPELLDGLTNYAANQRQNCLALIEELTSRTPPELSAVGANGLEELDSLLTHLQAMIVALSASDPSLRIVNLQRELHTLLHSRALAVHLDEVLEHVRRYKWAAQAAKLGGSTRHITKKHNDLFASLVTERYLALFAHSLKQLNCPHAIAVDTRGRKGETIKQLVIRADPSIPTGLASPDTVLSEGEKRAIALADFLTEVALDEGSGGIILDDPVTSLDFEWKEIIGARLVDEARRRQVIIFTHDLHFLYLLKDHTEKAGVDIATHWIRRGEDDRPGYVFRDNSPAMEREYRTAKRARAIHMQAKTRVAEDQERLLREGFGALRTCYEAFVIFDLFNEVVLRFNERVSIGRLADVVVDPELVKEVDASVSRLSRFIEGHLHSDVTALKPLTPQALQEEIERFEALKKRHKAAKESLTLLTHPAQPGIVAGADPTGASKRAG